MIVDDVSKDSKENNELSEIMTKLKTNLEVGDAFDTSHEREATIYRVAGR